MSDEQPYVSADTTPPDAFLALLRAAGLTDSDTAVLLRHPEHAQRVVKAIRKELGQLQKAASPRQWRVPNEFLDTPIKEFPVSTRTHNVLRRIGVYTLADLILRSEVQIATERQVGPMVMAEIRSVLEHYDAALLPATISPRQAVVQLYGSLEDMHPRHLVLWYRRMHPQTIQYLQRVRTVRQLVKLSFDDLSKAPLSTPLRGETTIGRRGAEEIRAALQPLGLNLREAEDTAN